MSECVEISSSKLLPKDRLALGVLSGRGLSAMTPDVGPSCRTGNPVVCLHMPQGVVFAREAFDAVAVTAVPCLGTLVLIDMAFQVSFICAAYAALLALERKLVICLVFTTIRLETAGWGVCETLEHTSTCLAGQKHDHNHGNRTQRSVLALHLGQ